MMGEVKDIKMRLDPFVADVSNCAHAIEDAIDTADFIGAQMWTRELIKYAQLLDEELKR